MTAPRFAVAALLLAGITSSNLAAAVGVALHPGAAHAYRERGLID